MLSTRSLLLSLILAAGLALPGLASADTPPFFPVQGVLTDSGGAAIDGRVSIRFALYTSATGGSSVWSETQSVDVEEGAFTAYLGDGTDLDPALFRDNGTLWLGITVESDDEMPRVELGSAAFAAVAQYALDVPADVPRGDQACNPGDVVAGIDAEGAVVCVPDADTDTTYSGADFTLSDQLCTVGEVVQGIDANGLAICVTDTNTTYSGSDFATSGQLCTTGNLVLGIDANGDVICAADSSNTYSGVDFALSNQSCSGSDIATGFDATGTIQCTAAPTAVTSVGGLTGGTISGNVVISGDLTVTGSATLGNEPIGYPTGPQAFFGFDQGCLFRDGTHNFYVQYPVPFSADPVFVGAVDETLDDNGATWLRIRRHAANRTGIRCSARTDAVHWMAIEPGVHTIDGKMVQAGIHSVSGGTVSSGAAVFFSTPFPSPPVVILTVDESGDDNGATYTRLINSVTTGGFELYVNNNADAIHWVAFQPGEYNYGRWHWNADVITLNNSCTGGFGNCQMALPNPMFTGSPSILATVHDTNNSGASYVRHRNITSTEWTARFNTSTEAVHYVAFELDP